MTQTVTSRLQRTDGLLESLLVGFTDTHDLAHSAHLGAQPVLHAFEFLESPAGKLDHHIVAVRHIFIQRAVFSTGDVFQRQACRQHGRHQGDGEARSLAGQRGRTGSTGIDLDHDDPVRHRVMGELHIGAADHLHRFHDLVSLLLQPLLALLRDRQHGGGTEGIAGVNSQRVDILDKTYGNDIVVRIPHHFQLQLFPAENRLLHQNLSHQTGL